MPEPSLPPHGLPSLVGFREEIVKDGVFDRLVRFHALAGGALAGAAPATAHRVLIIAPLSGINPRLLHDMVADMAPWCDLHLLEWRDAAEVPAPCGGFGLADCLSRVLDAVQQLGEVDLIGLCQSALPALAATALLASSRTLPNPRSLVLIGGKIDPRINPTVGDKFAFAHSLDWFRAHALSLVPEGRLGAGRAVYAHETQRRVLWSYVNRHMADGCDIIRKALHDDGLDPAGHPFLSDLASLIDVPAEFFLDVIATVYHADALAHGTLRWCDLPVTPGLIRETALLTIEGGRDDIAGPGQCEVAHRLCPAIPKARRGHRLFMPAGHFNLFHGAVWHDRVHPVVRDFLCRHP